MGSLGTRQSQDIPLQRKRIESEESSSRPGSRSYDYADSLIPTALQKWTKDNRVNLSELRDATSRPPPSPTFPAPPSPSSPTPSTSSSLAPPVVSAASHWKRIWSSHKAARKTVRPPKKKESRMIKKDGKKNVVGEHIMKQKLGYIKDIFTTLVDLDWKYIVLGFPTIFIISWLLFASIWYLLGWRNQDFVAERINGNNYQPCIMNVHDFRGALLFSIETQHTIGYGSRYITETCPTAVTLFSFQAIFGALMQALIVGIVFAKVSMPKRRAHTLIFSKFAVISMRDGALTLLFRVGDMRKSFILNAHCRLSMIRSKFTSEGEEIPMHQYELDVGYEAGLDRLFLIWPTFVEHKINDRSPLYNVSAESLPHEQFELMALVEGVTQSTSLTTQARTSYLPSEILWGHRFLRLRDQPSGAGRVVIDFGLFNMTVADDSPKCSALELSHRKKEAVVIENKKSKKHVTFRRCSSVPAPE